MLNKEEGLNIGSINEWYVFINKDMEPVRGMVERGNAIGLFYEKEIRDGEHLPNPKFFSQPPLLVFAGYLENFVECYKEILDRYGYKCYSLLLGKEFDFRKDAGFEYMYNPETHKKRLDTEIAETEIELGMSSGSL